MGCPGLNTPGHLPAPWGPSETQTLSGPQLKGWQRAAWGGGTRGGCSEAHADMPTRGGERRRVYVNEGLVGADPDVCQEKGS